MSMGKAGDLAGGLEALLDGFALAGVRFLDDPPRFAGKEDGKVAEALARWRRH